MKTMICALLLSVFLTIRPAQSDSTALNYYPLNNSDYWQYHERIQDNSGVPITFHVYYSLEVTGDSILPNGKQYKILEKNFLGSAQPKNLVFERVDTLTGNVYRYDPWAPNDEMFLDSLKSQPGDTCAAARYISGLYGDKSFCDSIYADTVLNFSTTSKGIALIDPLHNQRYILSQGLGLVYEIGDYDFGYDETTILYARINGIEYGTPVKIESAKTVNLIQNIKLEQNYPNPFNPETTMEFQLEKPSRAELKLFSADGRLVETLVSENLPAGWHRYQWHAGDNSSGVYFYRLTAGKSTNLKKCLLLK